jgi:hypothetical protein
MKQRRADHASLLQYLRWPQVTVLENQKPRALKGRRALTTLPVWYNGQKARGWTWTFFEVVFFTEFVPLVEVIVRLKRNRGMESG